VELDTEVVLEVGFAPGVVFAWVMTCDTLASPCEHCPDARGDSYSIVET
jgi:hypothetical protein